MLLVSTSVSNSVTMLPGPNSDSSLAFSATSYLCFPFLYGAKVLERESFFRSRRIVFPCRRFLRSLESASLFLYDILASDIVSLAMWPVRALQPWIFLYRLVPLHLLVFISTYILLISLLFFVPCFLFNRALLSNFRPNLIFLSITKLNFSKKKRGNIIGTTAKIETTWSPYCRFHG